MQFPGEFKSQRKDKFLIKVKAKVDQLNILKTCCRIPHMQITDESLIQRKGKFVTIGKAKKD